MAAPQNFRAAFNGFNRDDVVNYISYITTKYENQVSQLRSEAEELRQELEARPAAGETPEEVETLRAQIAQLQTKLKEKDARIAQLQEQAETAVREETQPSPPSVTERELEAYRRAESAERRAMERVDQMYARANGILADTVARLQENTGAVNDIAERVRCDLEALENAVLESKKILDDSTDMVASIKGGEACEPV